MNYSAISDTKQAFEYIESFTNLEKGVTSEDKHAYRLRRMRELLALFDDPHEAFTTLHIAGTKGKGSTAVLLAAVLEEAGYKTGVYASPHVSSYLERMNVSLAPPEQSLIVTTVSRIRDVIDTMKQDLPGSFAPTTFELLTLTAFLIFREAGCDYGVIETGIGGRVDATNIINPRASLITRLDLEHTQLLGDTLPAIAREKGGIIKPGIPAFCGIHEAECKQVFREIAESRQAPIFFLDEELRRLETTLAHDGTDFVLELQDSGPRHLQLTMLGEFQAENAALAYMCLTHLMPEIPADAYARGFRKATLPGRMEIIGRRPLVIIDGAHTPLSVRKLLDSYTTLYPEKGILIFGSVQGKNPGQMAEILTPHFRHVIVSTPGTFKESDPQNVFDIFEAQHDSVELVRDPRDALERALQLSHQQLPILVTGSFYMIGEIRALRDVMLSATELLPGDSGPNA